MALLMGALGATGQGSPVGIGTDASLWASGWRNVHVAVPIMDEVRLHAGFGWMPGSLSNQGVFLRPRPEQFNAATEYSFSLRAFPSGKSSRAWSELFGAEVSGESYRQAPIEHGLTEGFMSWNRTDVRVFAGAEWRIHDRFTASAHLGIGRTIVSGGDVSTSVFDCCSHPHANMTRMLGFELLFWP